MHLLQVVCVPEGYHHQFNNRSGDPNITSDIEEGRGEFSKHLRLVAQK